MGPVLGPSWFILSLGVRFRGHQAAPGFSAQLVFFFNFSSGSGLAIPAFAVVSARADGPAASGAEGPGTGHLRWAEGPLLAGSANMSSPKLKVPLIY